MPDVLHIKNALIASADSPALTPAHLLIVGGTITRLGEDIGTVPGVARSFDCGGTKIVVPALFDLNVHLSEPGRTDKESIASGTEAAIHGGVTGVVAMPSTSPPIDSGGLVRTVLDIAAREARIPVHTAGCITRARDGKEMAGIGSMAEAGVRMITDDAPVPNPLVLRLAMEYAREFDLVVACHCETPELSGQGAMNEGARSYKLGIPGIPTMSEEIALERDIRIAKHTGCAVHVQHVSTAHGVEIIKRFKDEGVQVTCEVTPHHLLFNEEHIVDYDSNYKTAPPLRTPADNAALLEGLASGVFDVIASDHSPHTDFEKQQQDFTSSPFGIIGLETALVSLFHHFIEPGTLTWDIIARHYSSNPRSILGLDPVRVAEGAPAEFLIFNPDATTTFSRELLQSKSINTPFLGQSLHGRVDFVIRDGNTLLNRFD